MFSLEIVVVSTKLSLGTPTLFGYDKDKNPLGKLDYGSVEDVEHSKISMGHIIKFKNIQEVDGLRFIGFRSEDENVGFVGFYTEADLGVFKE